MKKIKPSSDPGISYFPRCLFKPASFLISASMPTIPWGLFLFVCRLATESTSPLQASTLCTAQLLPSNINLLPPSLPKESTHPCYLTDEYLGGAKFSFIIILLFDVNIQIGIFLLIEIILLFLILYIFNRISSIIQ